MQAPGPGFETPKSCPCCGVAMQPDAVLCIDCGYDLRTGELIPGLATRQPTQVESDNPYQPTHSVATYHERPINWAWALALMLPNCRVTRRVWWLSHLVVIAVMSYMPNFEGALVPDGSYIPLFVVGIGILNLCMLWSLFCVNANRWHDMDRSSLWILVTFFPCLGQMYCIVELGFDRGTEGPNDYGDDPRWS